MTKDNQVEDLSCDDTQEQKKQERPFHLVLVDLKKAADGEIYCVEKPLKANPTYVAISYRWGELDETAIDTKMGYIAVIKSFALDDFYDLCKMIRLDADMKDIDYVWVDTICINQTNHAQRKATIYQMSNIYESATYIVAVPDLHKEHLSNTSTIHTKIMEESLRYRKDIYHLLHGNAAQLARLDNDWLDTFKAPDDSSLRQLLMSTTDYFTDGLMKDCHRYIGHNSLDILDHLYETCTTEPSQTTTTTATTATTTFDDNNNERKRLHPCDRVDCPVDLADDSIPSWRIRMAEEMNSLAYVGGWKQLIYERSDNIRQSMYFLMGLIKDWSSRVWVISEYNIAKKKNNMKFWFIQLGDGDSDEEEDDFTFFKFDFKNNAFANMPQYSYNDPVYIMFYQLMTTQLVEKNVLEMLLNSRASKHEDRFYAVLPITEYKDKIGHQALNDNWKMETITCVKTRLFELMNTKDKLNLLFLSGHERTTHIGMILPSFVNSTIDWKYDRFRYFAADNNDSCNFDLTSMSAAITLFKGDDNNNNNNNATYLNLKPRKYYIYLENVARSKTRSDMKKSQTQWKTHFGSQATVVAAIPQYQLREQAPMITMHDARDMYDNGIYLTGNFETNVWLLATPFDDPYDNDRPCWECHSLDDDLPTGFNIY